MMMITGMRETLTLQCQENQSVSFEWWQGGALISFISPPLSLRYPLLNYCEAIGSLECATAEQITVKVKSL